MLLAGRRRRARRLDPRGSGSRFFSAPELADGRAADVTPAADVYSLGKLLYWLFADGRCFDREKHCDPAFDLRAKEPRLAHALVYEILNRTLVEKPRDRFFQNGNTLADSVDTYAEVLEMRAHVLDLDVRQQCLFCGVGEYKIRVDPRWFVGELHPRPEQKPNEWMDFAGGCVDNMAFSLILALRASSSIATTAATCRRSNCSVAKGPIS